MIKPKEKAEKAPAPTASDRKVEAETTEAPGKVESKAPVLALESDPRRREQILESVTWPARRAGWAVQKRVLWPTADMLRRFAEVATWPFERVVWAFRTRIAWPVSDRVSESARPVRTAVAVSAVGLAVAAAGAGAITGSPDGPAVSDKEPVVASSDPIPLPDASERALFSGTSSDTDPEPTGSPVLLGVAPSFAVAKSPSDAGSGDLINAGAGGTPINSDAGPGAPPPVPGTDQTLTAAKADIPEPDTVKPALQVSRQFADAFVLYEIGEGDQGIATAFKQTAAKPLIRALEKRPPRLPKGVKVPQAKVLNVVPGPRKGKSLSVSVALVRLGASSELRLRLRHDKKTGWLVSDVRG